MDQRPCADGLRPAVEQTPYPQNESRRVHIAPQWPVWPALLNWHQLRTAGPWKWERAAMQRQLPPLVAPRRIIRTNRDQLLGGSSSRSRDRTPRGIIKPKPRSTPRCSQRRRITTPATCPPPLKGRDRTRASAHGGSASVTGGLILSGPRSANRARWAKPVAKRKTIHGAKALPAERIAQGSHCSAGQDQWTRSEVRVVQKPPAAQYSWAFHTKRVRQA